MSKKNRTRPTGGTAGRAAETGSASRADTTSKPQFTPNSPGGQRKIADLLSYGQENGLHLRDLVKLTGWPEREVRAQIHRERRKHIPILSNNRDGYYLPGDEQERAACVRSMRHRAAEILAAAKAIEIGGDADWPMR